MRINEKESMSDNIDTEFRRQFTGTGVLENELCEGCGKSKGECKCPKEEVEETTSSAGSSGSYNAAIGFRNTMTDEGLKQGLFASPDKFMMRMESKKKKVIKLTEDQAKQLMESLSTSTVGDYQYDFPAIAPPNKWKYSKKKMWPGGKIVKVKDKCKYFPYCEFLDALVFEGKHGELLETVSHKTGKSKEQIIEIIKKEMGYGK